jgi:hypothetical protein
MIEEIPKDVIELYPYLTRDENVKRMKTEGRFFASYITNQSLREYCDRLCQFSNGGKRGE